MLLRDGTETINENHTQLERNMLTGENIIKTIEREREASKTPVQHGSVINGFRILSRPNTNQLSQVESDRTKDNVNYKQSFEGAWKNQNMKTNAVLEWRQESLWLVLCSFMQQGEFATI